MNSGSCSQMSSSSKWPIVQNVVHISDFFFLVMPIMPFFNHTIIKLCLFSFLFINGFFFLGDQRDNAPSLG